MSDLRISVIQSSLGAFPPLNLVVSRLFLNVYHFSYYLSGLEYYEGVYHVSNHSNQISMWELVAISVGKTQPVGADLVADPAVFLNLLTKNGVDIDIIADEVLRRQVSDSSSVVRRNVLDAIVANAEKTLKTVDRLEKIIIPYDLTATEQARLISQFPEFNIVHYNRPKRQPHAYSAASRLCESQLVLSKLNYRSSTKPSAGYVATVKDVGGNFFLHCDRGRVNIHSCCSVLDARDVQRHSVRINNLKSLKVTEGRKKLFTCLSDNAECRKIMCTRKAQECPVTAPVIIMVHSSYDMTATEIADAFDSANAVIGYAVVMFDLRVIEDISGEIIEQKFLWRVYEGGKK